MQCPNDGATLVMSDRSGVEIDYCPTCRGVWLDRGELDKIIDRSLTHQQPPANPAAPAPQAAQPMPGSYEYERDQRQAEYQQQRYQKHPQQPHRRKRKESWLGEIFDF